ncbi:MAG: hypothetical protein K2W82_15335 [Candidatus Obscuribacterales bacterium]|jgi:hypothetical protein|nr:hypothetical protein [Candidatus Obscuribacterales bacterium]
MYKQIVCAMALALTYNTAAMAQGQYDSEGNPGAYGNDSGLTTQRFQDDSNFTDSQGVGSENGPLLPGTPSIAPLGALGSGGAATGAPFAGTFTAPANLALQNMGGRKTLPPTRLESFVRASGFSDRIYGDEGAWGLPPYFGFDASHYIGTGMQGMGELTTGHKGEDLPSAWGYPQ